jgi:hypothetical protein
MKPVSGKPRLPVDHGDATRAASHEKPLKPANIPAG